MKRKGIILLFIISILFMSVISSANFASAGLWSSLYGKIIIKDTAAVVVGGETSPGNSSCTEGELRDYTCSDGTKVEWCICNPGGWICANSPEDACPHSTCSMPVCAGNAYNTGEYDENNCPIYKCPEGETCSPGIATELVCPDGTTVPECKCTSEGKLECIDNPKSKCPQIICPAGCICANNAVACPANVTSTATAAMTESGIKIEPAKAVAASAGGGSGVTCPAGCECTKNTITCPTKNNASGCATGCKITDNCVLQGTRMTIENVKKYCDIDSALKEQKKDNEKCDNNYECETNLCINGKCLASGLWQKILNWFSRIFG